jgi:hypothetical protein
MHASSVRVLPFGETCPTSKRRPHVNCAPSARPATHAHWEWGSCSPQNPTLAAPKCGRLQGPLPCRTSRLWAGQPQLGAMLRASSPDPRVEWLEQRGRPSFRIPLNPIDEEASSPDGPRPPARDPVRPRLLQPRRRPRRANQKPLERRNLIRGRLDGSGMRWSRDPAELLHL